MYTQPNYNSQVPRLVRAVGFDRNIKVMGDSRLFYPTPDYTLVVYDLHDLQASLKSGGQYTPETFNVKECIQGFDFLNKVFSLDRVVVLTADGRVIKGMHSEKTWVVKRDVALPDQIDTNLLFTELATIGDNTLVAGFNTANSQNLLVLLSRGLDTVDRCVLTEQSSHISRLQVFEARGKNYIMAVNQFNMLNLLTLSDKIQVVEQNITIGECKQSD